jgi:DNA-binding IclR family transcriptional regulator
MKVNAIAFSLLIELLMEGDYTSAELVEETGLHSITIYDYLRALRKRKLLHIARWETDTRGRCCVKVYKLGRGVDAKKQTVSPSEKSRRYRARKRQATLLGITNPNRNARHEQHQTTPAS